MAQQAEGPSGRRQEVEREFLASALYLGIVLYAVLAVVPESSLPSDRDLVLLMLSSGVGLILAHWFSFHLASMAVSQEGRGSDDLNEEAGAQVAGGALVAVLSTLPFLVFNGERAVQTTLFMLGLLPAVAGFAIGRRRGHSVLRSAVVAALVLLVASAVTAVKITTLSH